MISRPATQEDSGAGDGDLSRLVGVVAPAPPPLTGQSAYFGYLQGLLAGRPAIFFPLRARQTGGGLRSYLIKIGEAFAIAFRLLRKEKCHRVLMVLDGGFGLSLNILLTLAARLRGAEMVYSHHSFAYVDRRSGLMTLLQLCAGRKRTNIFLCGRMQDLFEARYGTSPHLVLSNSGRVLSEPLAPDPARGDEGFTLGYLSNLSFEKGIREYVEVVERLNSEGVEAHGVIAGPAFDAKVADYVEDAVARSNGRLSWIGPVYGAEKATFLASISVLVFPTAYANEAQPNVLFEAIRNGVPVVSIARGCIADDMADTGSLVLPANSDFVAPAAAHIAALAGDQSPAAIQRRRDLARSRFAAMAAEAQLAEARLVEVLFAR